MTTVPETLDQAIEQAGGAIPLLRESQFQPWQVPVLPAEHSNWRNEQLAARQTAVIFDQSHHMTSLHVVGPGALDLFKKLGVNSFENFPVDRAKQFVTVAESGYLIGDCILFHLAEDSYRLVGSPVTINWVRYNVEIGGYDLTATLERDSGTRGDEPPSTYRYQVQGPNALKIFERVLGEEPPTIPFFSMTRFSIAGRPVRALRHGMSGAPGYELFGPWEDRDAVLEALLEAGRDLGVSQVGAVAYPSNTLESGWIPLPLPAIYTGTELTAYRTWLPALTVEAASLGGSFVAQSIEDHYVTPYDIGYGRHVKFDHDFIGRAALEEMVANGRSEQKVKVTLVWNAEDVEKILGSILQPGIGAKYMRFPLANYSDFQYDSVVSEGQQVGMSTWVGYSANERAVLSLAIVDRGVSEPGTPVEVVWGENPASNKPQVEHHKQVSLRATVQPAPIDTYARTLYRANRP